MLSLIGKTMLAAIQFDVQCRLLAKEIKVVDADGMLTAKLVAAETPSAQPAPHEFFRPRFIFAKLAGALDVGHDANLRYGDETKKLVFLA